MEIIFQNHFYRKRQSESIKQKLRIHITEVFQNDERLNLFFDYCNDFDICQIYVWCDTLSNWK